MKNYPDSLTAQNTFAFYIMLGMITEKDCPNSSSKNINEYKKLLRKENVSEKMIELYIHKASTTLPSEFLSVVGLQGVYFKERQTFFTQDKQLTERECKTILKEEEEEDNGVQ